MLVNEIMAKDVVTISSDDTVLEACKRYNKYKIGCLIVMNENHIAGVVQKETSFIELLLIKKILLKQKLKRLCQRISKLFIQQQT